MKGLGVVALATLALALPAVAMDFNPVAGNYVTTISGATPAVVNGRRFVQFAPDGRYVIEKDLNVLVRGRGSVKGNRITFGHESGPAACKTPAVYRFTLRDGHLLRLQPVTETCAGRSSSSPRTRSAGCSARKAARRVASRA